MVHIEVGRVEYWFYHDDGSSTYARIHVGHCPDCNHGTGKFDGLRPDLWSGPYVTAEDAWSAALEDGRTDVQWCGNCEP